MKQELLKWIYENKVGRPSVFGLGTVETVYMVDLIEMINELEEPQVTNEQAWNKIAETYPETAQNLRITLDHAVYGHEAEPQKVKVPAVVAKWISKCRELKWILPDLLAPEAFESSFARDTEEWLRQDKQNYDILARAWLSGYEVEEEPKYQVKLKFGRQYLSKNADGNMLDFYSCMVFPPRFSKKELESIEDGAFYKADGDKEWINPIIELVPVEKV